MLITLFSSPCTLVKKLHRCAKCKELQSRGRILVQSLDNEKVPFQLKSRLFGQKPAFQGGKPAFQEKFQRPYFLLEFGPWTGFE